LNRQGAKENKSFTAKAEGREGKSKMSRQDRQENQLRIGTRSSPAYDRVDVTPLLPTVLPRSRSPALPVFQHWSRPSKGREDNAKAAEIGRHLGLHYTTVSKVVNLARTKK
jgi:hypothetical protein